MVKFTNYLFLFMCVTKVQLINGESLKRSLIIVFDSTGSMGDEIDALRHGVKLLLENFTSRQDNPISEYIFVQFRDEDIDQIKYPAIIETDVNKIHNLLATFDVDGGGDCLESAFRGIKYGLEAAKDNSIMFVFTDAGTKHKELKPDLEKLIQRKRIAIYFFLTMGCGLDISEKSYYYDLTKSSNGEVFDVDYLEIKKHFTNYRDVINENLGLSSVFEGPAGKSNVSVIVDSSMKEFTFTIVAQKPLITIFDPNNVQIDNFKKLTDLSTIKMVKVVEPTPGQWTVQIEAASPYSGQVSVISDLSFKYGFAVHEPDAITQTSFSPMIGQNNYLAILPSDPKLIGTLEHVVLATKSGGHNYALRKKTGTNGDLYVTESLKLPKIPFKVELHGLDPLNHAIKRLLSPDIASRNPDKPETGIIPKINVDEGLPIYLICRVDSMVPINITWWKVGQSSALKSLTTLQSNILNYTIPESNISDNGDYMCVAENSVGRSESKTVVDVRHTILNVNTPIKQHTPIISTRSLVLKCVVTPKIASVKISWLFNGRTELPRGSSLNLPNLVLNNIDRSANGTYTCLAQRNTEIMQDNIEVNVLYPAKILNVFNLNPFSDSIIDISKPIEIFDQSEIKIMCGHEGNPTPDVKWINQDGDVVSYTSVLVVDGNDITQDGEYLCQAENLAGKDEEWISVDISVKPKLLMQFETNYRVKLNDQFSLECPLEIVPQNKIDIFWYHNGSRIQDSLILNDRVTIDKLDHAHNGQYNCWASNKAGAVEAQFNVDVLYEASILKIVKISDTGSDILDPSVTSLDIYNTTTFSLTCIVDGNPPPITTWKKNGVIFSNTHKLTIDPRTTEFPSSYECSTENELNYDDWTINLVEMIKPKLLPYSILQNLIEDKEFHLICPIESGDYNVTWYLNGNNFDSHNQADGSLLIDKVRPDMKGRAYCVATNKAGTAVASFNFVVLRPPYGLSVTTSSYRNPIQQIAPKMKQIEVIINEPLDMTCNGLGNPTPEIYWLKNNRMYSFDNTFDILSVEPKDDATYTCVAENPLGKQTEKIVLVVYVPPFLLNSSGLEYSTNTNNANKLGVTVLNRVPVPTTYFRANYQRFVNVTEGDKVVLDCKMNGKPKPKVIWFKNNENLNTETDILEFTNAKVENSGIYKCFGDNGRGKMIVIFYLNVHKPISIVTATSTKAVYNIGEEIKLTCKTTGNQLPVIVWRGKGDGVDNENIFKSHDYTIRKQLLQQNEPIYLNGKKVIKHSDIHLLARYGKLSYEFLDGEYIGTLEYVIKSARFNNAGDYACVSRIFKVKKVRVEKFVTIQVVKAPYVENAETIYSILQGIESHKIKCPIQALPRPTIEWYHGTSVITSNQHLDIQNYFLEFKSPTMHQAGDYLCRGTNNGGTVEFKFKVNIVNHIADITNIVLNRSRKTKIQVEKNKTKVLECSIKVEPTYWSQIIDAYPNKKRELLVVQPTYILHADVSKDIMCSKDADPEYGELFRITVLEKPIIETTENIVEVKLDDVLRLQCEATGEPKPAITWYKYVNEQLYDINYFREFQTNDEILIKRRAENFDTAKYVCIAQNSVGEDSHVFEVTVLNDSHYFAPWSKWSTCSKTCGEGVQFKTRDCVHPICNQSRQREERNCTMIKCPVHGGWSDYFKFGQCSKSCVIDLVDVAIKEARRECNNPTPAYGGEDCIGLPVRIINCTVPLCESILTEEKLDYSACSDQEICCPAGFVYDAQTGGCQEIDKCKRTGPYTVCGPSQKCQNIGIDDYECVCRPGYRQKNYSRSYNNPNKNPRCYDINECKAEPYPCGTKRCANNMGSFRCV